MKPREIGQYLIADPGICFGRVTFKGTRLPVKTVLEFMALGRTIDDILKSLARPETGSRDASPGVGGSGSRGALDAAQKIA